MISAENKSEFSFKSSIFKRLQRMRRIVTKLSLSSRRFFRPFSHKTIDQEKIKQLIAHRDPFLFVDRIIEWDGQKHILCERSISEKNTGISYTEILEGLGQAGCLIIKQLPQFQGTLPVFTGMKQVLFHDMDIVKPGDILTYDATLTAVKNSKFGTVESKAFLNEQLVCEAELLFATIPEK